MTAGQAFGLTVAVEDAYGNVETGYSGSVTVALSTNPRGAALGRHAPARFRSARASPRSRA